MTNVLYQMGHFILIAYLFLTSHLQSYNLPTNPHTSLGVIFTYLLTYSFTYNLFTY